MTVRAFAAEEWRLYRELRLRALSDSPDAFGSTYAREILYTDAEWADRLARAASSSRDLPLLAEWEGEPSGLAWVRLDESQPTTAHVYQMRPGAALRSQTMRRSLVPDAEPSA